MIRSLSSWHASNPARWDDDQLRYRKYLKKITPRLPSQLAQLTDQYSLHDDRISDVQIVSGVSSGRDALVTIKIYRDGVIGSAGLLVLHLIGLSGAMKKAASHLDIMFYDVEMMGDSMFRLTFALDEKKTWSVKFRDFDYYFHDYQKQS